MAKSLLFTIQSNSIRPSAMSSSLYGCHIVIKYYQEVYSAGITKVSWDFYTGYAPIEDRTTNSGSARATVRTNVYATVGDIISNVTGAEYDSGSGNNVAFVSGGAATNTYLGSGSCLIKHDSSGNASFKVVVRGETAASGEKCGFYIGGWGTEGQLNPVKGTTFTVTLEKNQHYTACGNPTSVSASGIITPNGTFTVSWSGATAGTANPIYKYRVYYRLSSNKSVPSMGAYTSYKDVSASTTSTSFTVSGATRGYYIVCGVLTLPTVDGYGPTSLATGGSVRINSLPAAPSVSVSPAKLPSTGGQVTFTIDAGADSDGQTRTLYYGTTTDVNKATKVTSPWKPTIGTSSAKTYYFWTYDGLEYSSKYTSKSVTLNEKPVISVKQSGTNLTSANSISSYSYVIAPTVTVTQSKGTGKTYNYYLSYGTSTSNIGNKTLISSTSSKTLSITDVRIHGMTPTTSGYYYRFSVICNDGMENSDEVSSNIFYITRMPRITGVYNKTGYQNITGFASGNIATHYSKYLGFSFEYDAGYDSLKFVDINDAQRTISISGNSSSGLRGYIANSSATADSATTVNLKYRVGYLKSGCYADSTNKTITKIAQISPSNLKLGIGTYKYFTQTDKTFDSTINPNFGANPTDGSLLKDFGLYFTGTPSYLKGKIHNGSSWSDMFDVAIEKLDDDTIKFVIKASDLAKYFSSISNKNTFYTSKLQLIFINNFGKEFFTKEEEGKFTTDFREPDYISMDIRNYNMYMSDDIYKNAISKWAYLKQGMGNLMGDFKVLSYNTGVKITIQSKQNNDSSWQKLISFDLSASTAPSPGARAEYTASSKLLKTIGEITTKNYNVSYRAIINTNGGSKTVNLYSNIKVRGHFAPVVLIKANTYKNKTLNVKYEIIENGADSDGLWLQNGKITLKSEDSADVRYIDNTSNYFDSASKNAIFTDYEFVNAEGEPIGNKRAKLVITSSLGTYLKENVDNIVFITQKTSSAELDNVIFNIVPTISYRKNHLGINVLDPDNKSDAILIIGETSADNNTRDTIYFQTAGSNLCKVVNFLLDGGTWGKI